MSDEEKSSSTLVVDTVENRMVQPGRICLIVYGKDYRKLVCIVDFIDRTRVLVDGANNALSGIGRRSMPLRWLQVTKFRVPIERTTLTRELADLVKSSDVVNEYNKSDMGRRNNCIQRKEALNDFGRFKLYYTKGQFKKAVYRELMKLRAAEKKIPVKQLVEQKRKRLETHPILRRVVGKYRRTYISRLYKKQKGRKNRLRRVGIARYKREQQRQQPKQSQ